MMIVVGGKRCDNWGGGMMVMVRERGCGDGNRGGGLFKIIGVEKS